MRFPRISRDWIIRIVALISLGFFIYLIWRLDPRRSWSLLRQTAWHHWIILMGARLVHWSLRTLNWRFVLRHYRVVIPPLRLLGARLAGHAIGTLTPSAKLGGEAVRVLILDDADKKKTLASVVVDKTIEFASVLLLLSGAALTAVLQISMPSSMRMIILGSTLTAAGGLIIFFLKQRKGLFIWLADGIGRLGLRIAAVEKRREKIKAVDALIGDFYHHRHLLAAGVFALHTATILFWVLEIKLTFLFTGGGDVGFLKCYLLVMLGSLCFLIPAVPASLGFYELTYLSLFALLGIDLEQGLAVILVRRVLSLVWAGIGLLPMLRMRRRALGSDRAATPSERNERS